ncbi:MAG: hypothetical protein LBK13_01595 [Spirochaetales bacterium]|nr:hypothetical protein [Spirochaetales bacterium]
MNSGVLVPRRRCGWEACDSGVLLWRRGFRPLLLFPGVPLLALAAGLCCVSGIPVFVSCIVLWWLKPLWDRLALQVISVRFFEPDSSPRRLFADLPGTLLRGLPGDLLWRRFSPWRAARLAVRVLEAAPVKTSKKSSRRGYRQRISSLTGSGLGFCIFLTVFCYALECAVLGGETLFCLIIWNIFGTSLYMEIQEIFRIFEPAFPIIYAVNLALLEGLYVCMGFGLYIKSRVEGEGWDIQLLLQKAVSSAARNSMFKTLLAAVVFCLLSAPLVFPDGADPPTAEESAAVPLEKLEEVLASPDFGGWRETWRIRLKQEPESTDEQSALPDFPKLTVNRTLRELIARTLRFILIAALSGFAVYAAWRFFHIEKDRVSGKTEKMYGKVSPADDPRGLLGRAGELYSRGSIREAWALCFRGARAACGASWGVVFPPGATPYNCLSLLRDQGRDIPEGFVRLVRYWVYYAYADRLPPEGAFEEALGFCHSLIAEEKTGG